MESTIILCREYKGNQVKRLRRKINWLINNFLPPLQLWGYLSYSSDLNKTIVFLPIPVMLSQQEEYPFMEFSSKDKNKVVYLTTDDKISEAILKIVIKENMSNQLKEKKQSDKIEDELENERFISVEKMEQLKDKQIKLEVFQ